MWRLLSYLSLIIIYVVRFIFPAVQIVLFISFLFSGNLLFFLSFLAVLFLNIILYLIFNFKDERLSPIEYGMLRKNNSDVLLLMAPKEIKKSSFKNNFYLQDWSAAWINTLEQEIGYFSVSDDIRDIKDKKCVIISSSISDIDSEFIKKNIQKGKTVIIEKPNEEVASYFGVKISKKNVKGKKITSKFLKGLPLNCNLDIISFRDFKILMEIDENPAIISKNLSKGKLILIFFDYSKQLVSLQQGVPAKDYSLRHKYGLLGITEPADMVYNEKFLNNNVPYADILENFIINLLDVPRWRKLPSGYSSAIVMSHDEDYCDERFIKMIEEEVDMQISPTFFATSFNTILTKNLKYMIMNNVEIGVHWDKFPNELFFRKKSSYDLYNQIKLLKTKVISSRIHFLKWGNHYTNAFRLLIENGIKVDSTYGMNFGKGYIFSTSYFFHPIDTNGIIMPILEFPFQVMEKRGGVDFTYLNEIIKENNDKYRGVLCFNFHLSKYRFSKDLRKKIIELALKNNVLIFNLREYYDFYNRRLNSSIKIIKNKIIIDAKTKLNLNVPHKFNEIKLDRKKKPLKNVDNFYTIPIQKGKHIITFKFKKRKTQ